MPPQEIQQWKEEYPDHIHEVPLQSGRFERIGIDGHPAPPCEDRQPQEQADAKHHVDRMEASHDEGGCDDARVCRTTGKVSSWRARTRTTALSCFPRAVDPGKVQATLKNRIVTVTAPIKEEARPVEIREG